MTPELSISIDLVCIMQNTSKLPQDIPRQNTEN